MTTSDTPEPTELDATAAAEGVDAVSPVAGGDDQPPAAAQPETAAAVTEPADLAADAAPAPATDAEAIAEPADLQPATLTPEAPAKPPAPATPAPETATEPAAEQADPQPATLTPEAPAKPPAPATPAPETATEPAAEQADPRPATLTPEADPTPAPAASAPNAESATKPADEQAGPGDEIDPDAGLGLPDAGIVLGPPNLGGFESGEIVSGTVLTVDKREAEIDLGDGKIGVVGDRHWSSGDRVDLTTLVKPGDTVEAAVLARADVKQRITLSHLWAQQKRGWEAVEGAAKDKSDLEATVTEKVKGGLSLDVNGIRAFMPASLVDVQTVNDLSPFIGQTFSVRVIEADRNKARLIVSRKAAMRASQRQQTKAALGDISVGQLMTGKVAQITDFGAFVDVEGVRGLVHKSEIGWSRARDPQRELTVGQEVEVKVLKVQPSRNRLGLTMRTESDPLAEIRKGDRYEATVTRLADFGAFAALPSGVEGLVHVSEMAEYRVFAPEEIVIPGEKVWVKVLKVDKKRRTVDLSIAQAIVPDPAEEIAANEAAAAAAEAKAAEPASDEAKAKVEAADAPADTAEPAEPESAEPESAEPESAEPEPAEPESAEPESAEPESAEPESADGAAKAAAEAPATEAPLTDDDHAEDAAEEPTTGGEEE